MNEKGSEVQHLSDSLRLLEAEVEKAKGGLR
jgi:hypothetical protein